MTLAEKRKITEAFAVIRADGSEGVLIKRPGFIDHPEVCLSKHDAQAFADDLLAKAKEEARNVTEVLQNLCNSEAGDAVSDEIAQAVREVYEQDAKTLSGQILAYAQEVKSMIDNAISTFDKDDAFIPFYTNESSLDMEL